MKTKFLKIVLALGAVFLLDIIITPPIIPTGPKKNKSALETSIVEFSQMKC